MPDQLILRSSRLRQLVRHLIRRQAGDPRQLPIRSEQHRLLRSDHRSFHQRLVSGAIRCPKVVYRWHDANDCHHLPRRLRRLSQHASGCRTCHGHPLGNVPLVLYSMRALVHADGLETLSTAYAAEICPIQLRGYLNAFASIGYGGGSFISSGVLKATSTLTGPLGWKIPYILQWIWPVPLATGCYFAPESELLRSLSVVISS